MRVKSLKPLAAKLNNCSALGRDISLANKTALLSEIDAFEIELYALKQLLMNEDSAGLQALFERASIARNNWAESKK